MLLLGNERLQPVFRQPQRLQHRGRRAQEQDTVTFQVERRNQRFIGQIPGMHARLAAGQQQAYVLPGAQRLSDRCQLRCRQRDRRGDTEFIQFAADAQRDQEILQRQAQ